MKNSDRQVGQVRALATAPRDDQEVLEYRVEQWPTGHLFVARKVWLAGSTRAYPCYSQGYVIGPRGGRKTLFDRLDT